jgi:hypothetical protein
MKARPVRNTTAELKTAMSALRRPLHRAPLNAAQDARALARVDVLHETAIATPESKPASKRASRRRQSHHALLLPLLWQLWLR